MQLETVLQLNHLNQQFYLHHADSFDTTRQHAWSGWLQLLPTIVTQAENKVLTVCDLGCGNGRFAIFLQEYLPGVAVQYWGFDQNESLLEKAAQKLNTDETVHLSQLDLVQSTIDEDVSVPADTDLVVLFGILHHIPSFSLRQSLFKQIAKQLKPGALIVVSFWQFAANERFQTKVLPPPTSINSEELEQGDYFLGWKDNLDLVRYCHHVTLTEAQQLLEATELHIKNTFIADGKSDDLNLYLVLEKRTQ